MLILKLGYLVLKNQLVRKLESALDWCFIYNLVKGKYNEEMCRSNLDPVARIKL